tara:strand:- start:5871 stop:6026 length:156 start_codon:yes stop_codon:yes gene_type:complete
VFHDADKDPQFSSVAEIKQGEKVVRIMNRIGVGIVLFVVLANILAIAALLW